MRFCTKGEVVAPRRKTSSVATVRGASPDQKTSSEDPLGREGDTPGQKDVSRRLVRTKRYLPKMHSDEKTSPEVPFGQKDVSNVSFRAKRHPHICLHRPDELALSHSVGSDGPELP